MRVIDIVRYERKGERNEQRRAELVEGVVAHV